jgi:hypothetical protein
MFENIPLVFLYSLRVAILTPCSRDMCSHTQKDKFVCGSTQVFATASVVVSANPILCSGMTSEIIRSGVSLVLPFNFLAVKSISTFLVPSCSRVRLY